MDAFGSNKESIGDPWDYDSRNAYKLERPRQAPGHIGGNSRCHPSSRCRLMILNPYSFGPERTQLGTQARLHGGTQAQGHIQGAQIHHGRGPAERRGPLLAGESVLG